MRTNSRLREAQREKLRALIQPIGDALEIEPADPEDTAEADIWGQVNDLYDSLTEFFDELAGPETGGAQQGGMMKKLLEDLHAGRCPGVKGATAYKIQKFAAERGYV